LAAPVGWILEKQTAIPGIIAVDKEKYFQGLLPIYTGTDFCGAISVLTSNKIVMDNTLQLAFTMVIVYLCCLVLIIPVALFFSGIMVKSLVKVTASLKDVAEGEGDLTQRIQITSKDEIGELSHWFNLFIEKLQKMFQDIVASATEEMTATINEIVKNAESARSMSRETKGKIENASAIEEQSVTTKEIADNTATVATGINDVNTNISQFDTLTTDIATQMETVNQASAKMFEDCTNINKDTQEMGTHTAKLDQLINRFIIK